MNRWLRLALPAVALIVLPSAAQQPRFAELHRMFPVHPDDDTRAVAATDIDGDGDVDFVFGDNGQDRLFLNDGLGLFAEAPVLPIDNDYTNAVVAGDLDGDGDVDLVFGQGMFVRLVLQVAPLTFFDATLTLPPGAGGAKALALGDVDGDGDLDLMIASVSSNPPVSPVRLWLNSGAAVFTDVTATWLPALNPSYPLYAVTFGDVNQDGYLDAFVGGVASGTMLVQSGSGPFTPITHAVTGSVGTSFDAVLADLDLDGKVDLVVANGSTGGGYAQRNLGGGTFTGPIAFPAGFPGGGLGLDLNLAIGDVDQDGDPDVVIGNSGATKAVYLTTPTGFVTLPTSFAPYPPVEMEATYALALADVDGDTDLDLVGAGGLSGPNRLYLNDSTGQFGDSGSPGPWKISKGVLGDIDLDADLDIFTGGSIWRNDGTGTFSEVLGLVPLCTLPWAPAPQGTFGPALGDLNGDGWIDVMGGSNFGSLLLLNNGAGGFVDRTFQISQLNLGVGGTWLVDVDQDGDLDSFVNTAPSGALKLYVNNGAAFFSPSPYPLPASNPAGGCAFGDFDGDGDFDVYRVTIQDRLWLNGGGVFLDVTATHLPVESQDGNAVGVGDVDQDGDLDLLVASRSVVAPTAPMLLLNDGTAHFTSAPSQLPPCLASTRDLKLVDVDGDGDLDAVLGNVTNAQYALNTGSLLWLNGGAGNFSDAAASIPFAEALELGVADIDLDGDVDIMAMGGYLRIFYNQATHLSWRTLPRIGKHLWLDVAGPPNGTWCIAADTSATSINLPGLGLLHLNPATATFFGCGALDPAGRVAIGMTVPPIPALIGVPYYVQTLVGSPPRLTNMEIVSCTGL